MSVLPLTYLPRAKKQFLDISAVGFFLLPGLREVSNGAVTLHLYPNALILRYSVNLHIVKFLIEISTLQSINMRCYNFCAVGLSDEINLVYFYMRENPV